MGGAGAVSDCQPGRVVSCSFCSDPIVCDSGCYEKVLEMCLSYVRKAECFDACLAGLCFAVRHGFSAMLAVVAQFEIVNLPSISRTNFVVCLAFSK